jgi:DNA-binding transcriptional LysR family regulator
MRIGDVEAFLLIVQAGSLASAARSSGAPKASLSHQLRRLERDLDGQLFERRLNRLHLTSLGRKFAPHAREIIKTCQTALDVAQEARASVGGVLRIGTTSEFSTDVVAPLTANFARSNPDLRIEVIIVPDVELADPADDLDCVLYLGDVPLENSAYWVRRKLGAIASRLYASPEFIASVGGAPNSPEELEALLLVGQMRQRAIMPWDLTDGDRVVTITPKPQIVTNGQWLLKLYAVYGFGISLLPEFFVKREVAAGALVPVLAGWTSRERPIHLLYARHRSKNTNVKKFAEAFQKDFVGGFQYPYALIVDGSPEGA